MQPVAPGDVLAGKYRVTKVLGVGGMGVVVAAEHVQLQERVAIKFMLPEALGSGEAVERFLREARAAVKLQSEHVARVRDVGTLETGAPYIVMEYLDGSDLSGVLSSRGPLPPDEAIEYVLQACDALAEAHALGIVHRDLKPANLFLARRRDATPLVKVLDFGISKSTALNEQGAGGLTKTGGIMGSPLYMSPEQMKSAKDTDARTDIWALGVILYELVGGRPPFDSDTLGGLMALVLTEPPTSLERVRPGLPPALYATIGKCLEKDRNARWPTVAHFAAALLPMAPARAKPLVERISIVLGQPETRPSVPPESFARTELPPQQSPAAVTDARWARSVSQDAAPKASKAGVIAGVIGGLALLGLVGVGVLKRTGAPAPAAPAAAVEAAPSAAPAAVIPAMPPPTATTPEPMPVASTAPPAESPSTTAAPPHAATPRPPPTTVAARSPNVPAAGSPAPAAAAPHATNCNPPYTVDPDGHRIAKPECM